MLNSRELRTVTISEYRVLLPRLPRLDIRGDDGLIRPWHVSP